MKVGDLVGFQRSPNASFGNRSDVLVGVIIRKHRERSCITIDNAIWRVLWSAPEGPTERGALERDLVVISG